MSPPSIPVKSISLEIRTLKSQNVSSSNIGSGNSDSLYAQLDNTTFFIFMAVLGGACLIVLMMLIAALFRRSKSRTFTVVRNPAGVEMAGWVVDGTDIPTVEVEINRRSMNTNTNGDNRQSFIEDNPLQRDTMYLPVASVVPENANSRTDIDQHQSTSRSGSSGLRPLSLFLSRDADLTVTPITVLETQPVLQFSSGSSSGSPQPDRRGRRNRPLGIFRSVDSAAIEDNRTTPSQSIFHSQDTTLTVSRERPTSASRLRPLSLLRSNDGEITSRLSTSMVRNLPNSRPQSLRSNNSLLLSWGARAVQPDESDVV